MFADCREPAIRLCSGRGDRDKISAELPHWRASPGNGERECPDRTGVTPGAAGDQERAPAMPQEATRHLARVTAAVKEDAVAPVLLMGRECMLHRIAVQGAATDIAMMVLSRRPCGRGSFTRRMLPGGFGCRRAHAGDGRWTFVGMGLLNNAIPFCLIVWGQTHIASGLAAILNATTPLFTVVVAHVLTDDARMTRQPARGPVDRFSWASWSSSVPAHCRVSAETCWRSSRCSAAAVSYAFAGVVRPALPTARSRADGRRDRTGHRARP